MSVDLSRFEARANEAEQMIAMLTDRLNALEREKMGNRGDDVIRVKEEMVEKLLHIRQEVEKDQEKADLLEQENTKLKTENEKLTYWVQHLLKMLEEAECDLGRPRYSYKEVNSKGSLEYRGFFFKNGLPLSPFHDIPLWTANPAEIPIVNMVVEIPKGTQAKMEISTSEPLNPIKQDVKKGQLRFVALKYPFHYGALPQTWEDPNEVDPATNAVGDNDPIDVIEIGSTDLKTGDVIKVKILGTYAMIDEGSTDWKIISINVKDPLADQLQSIEDVEKVLPGKLNQIFEFLRDYKIPDGKPPNTFGCDGKPQGRAFAMDVIGRAHQSWKKLMASSSSSLSLKNRSGPCHLLSKSEAARIVYQLSNPQ